MRIGVHIPCYRLTYFLPAVLRSVSWMDRILVTNSFKPWDSNVLEVDDTVKVCSNANLDNLELLRGNWSKDSEHNQRNMAMNVLSDCDYVFLLDSDEIMNLGDQRRILEVAAQTPEMEAFGVRTIPYFNDLSHMALYDEGNTPLALVKPSVRFFITRCITQPWKDLSTQFSIHHFKFLQPKSDIGWRNGAKHTDQCRKFNGVVPIKKNIELESFMESCGYTNFKSELQDIEVA